MRLLYKFILVLKLTLPSLVFAATQGTLGTTSTGTVDISITIPAIVQMTGLSDITLGTVSSYPVTGSTTACVYSNVASPLGSYFVTATSTNASTVNFRVVSGASDFVTYTAAWNNTAAVGASATLASGTKTAQQTGGSATSVTCGGSANANFNVTFSAVQVQGAPAGTYTDTVTILISPT